MGVFAHEVPLGDKEYGLYSSPPCGYEARLKEAGLGKEVVGADYGYGVVDVGCYKDFVTRGLAISPVEGGGAWAYRHYSILVVRDACYLNTVVYNEDIALGEQGVGYCAVDQSVFY